MTPSLKLIGLFVTLSAILNTNNAAELRESSQTLGRVSTQADVSETADGDQNSLTDKADQTLKQYGFGDDSDRYDDDETVKRAMGMLRLGRARSRQSSGRTMSALRLGRRGSPTIQNIDSLGAQATVSEDGELSSQDFDKRKSMSLLRLGRGHENQLPPDTKKEEKKAMSALRLGRKRGSGFLDANEQRDDNGVSTSAEDDVALDVSSGVVKRAMSMLRLGRNLNADDESLNSLLAAAPEVDVDAKRAMSMLRLGRQTISSLPKVERRKSMSMLRLG